MKPDRLNAFTDGVIAIIITIMVLEIRLPDEPTFAGVREMAPFLGIYLLSFVNVGIFWNNHHHMMQGSRKVDGRVLWANLFLLFWLSLFPFLIRWIGERGVTSVPAAAFGIVLAMGAIAYLVLERSLIRAEGERSEIAVAVGGKRKEWLSLVAYALGVLSAFLVSPYLSVALYIAVGIVWFIPDQRFERRLQR